MQKIYWQQINNLTDKQAEYIQGPTETSPVVCFGAFTMSLGNFMCCRDKELTCFVCVCCLNVFHKSCQKRKTFTVIKGHKIICSKTCESNYEAGPTTGLRKEIFGLQNELVNDEDGESHAFDGDVMEMADRYRRELHRLTELLRSKEEEIAGQKKKKLEETQAHLSEIQGARSEIQELGFRIARMKLQNSSLQSAVSALEADLKCLKRGSKNGVKRIGEEESRSSQKHDFASPSVEVSCMTVAGDCDGASLDVDRKQCLVEENDGHPYAVGDGEKAGELSDRRSSKIMILADEYGRGLNSMIRACLYSRKKECKVEAFIKPGAVFASIVEDIEALTRTYGVNDHVVIMAGTADIKNSRFPSFKLLLDKIRSIGQTNVTLISVPYFSENRQLNVKITKYNNKLDSFVTRLNQITELGVFFFNCNLKRAPLASKRALSMKIVDLVLSPRPIKNLIYIHPQVVISDNVVGDAQSDDSTVVCESPESQTSFPFLE